MVLQKKTIEQIPQNKCIGCSACYSVCGAGAIKIQNNGEGFYAPVIDKNLCTGCGLCYNICPENNICKGNNYSPKVFALQNKNDDVLSISSSGGVFYELAFAVINDGGVVYGCSMVNNIATHIKITNIDDINLLTGSKYVQSKVTCFSQIKTDLKHGMFVLFCGTPCQVSGLKSYLKKDYDNLICVDFICHGVPSPLVLEKYLKLIEEKNNTKIDSVKFRSKKFGWDNFAFEATADDVEIICEPRNKNIYLKSFLANISIRESCGNCKYNTIPRLSDITLGDFWEIDINNTDFDAHKGISLMLLNSSKGADIFNKISQKFHFISKSLDDVKKGNPFVDGHCKLSGKRTKFFDNLDKIPLEENIKECLIPTLYERITEILKYKINCIFKR